VNAVAEVLLAFVAFYPVCTAALWIAGGLLFRTLDEQHVFAAPDGGWPAVTILIPAYNEESVIATTVAAALRVDYPELEILVLDDGSHDGTVETAEAAAAGDPRCAVIRDPVNRGKADRLNDGFRRARHELVVVTDADTHLHPDAVRRLVARISRSPLVAAVAGAPHVTNRGSLLPAMQVLEAASIIGLIRRTQALTGRVGVVAGVLGIFRREAVLEVGGYEPRMATEDIDLSWRLILAGWHTGYEPRALVGMQVPANLYALWLQRKRWARGQGEVLHVHLRQVLRWRHREMWLLGLEAFASLAWISLLFAALIVSVLQLAVHGAEHAFGFGLAWGVAISVVATVQLAVAVGIEYRYDPRGLRAFLLAPIYPIAFWIVGGAAALFCEVGAFFTGPKEQRVVWDIPREPLEAAKKTGWSP
jgi:biofilm PGA synthesis N-glycosyltransferase PgaC